MDVGKYVFALDGLIEDDCLDRITLWVKDHPDLFEDAKIYSNGGMIDKVNKDIRDTSTIYMSLDHKSLTARHWHNYLMSQFREGLNRYFQEYNFASFPSMDLVDMQILRYKEKGHYDFHVDHSRAAPRTMSMILLLNDDYEGGNLSFADPDGSNQNIISNKKGRLILWPSNFLYPHKVNPVTKGTRYSIVCWAL